MTRFMYINSSWESVEVTPIIEVINGVTIEEAQAFDALPQSLRDKIEYWHEVSQIEREKAVKEAESQEETRVKDTITDYLRKHIEESITEEVISRIAEA